MKLWLLTCTFIVLLPFTALAAGQPRAGAGDPLPTPSALKSDVRFWESIFTKYGPDDC